MSVSEIKIYHLSNIYGNMLFTYLIKLNCVYETLCIPPLACPPVIYSHSFSADKI